MPILTLREIGDQGWGSVEVCDDAPGVEALARDSIQYLLMDLLLTHLPQLYQRGDDLVLVPEKGVRPGVFKWCRSCPIFEVLRMTHFVP